MLVFLLNFLDMCFILVNVVVCFESVFLFLLEEIDCKCFLISFIICFIWRFVLIDVLNFFLVFINSL